MSIKLKRPAAVSQETVARFLQSAGCALGQGDIKAAVEVLERARSLAPGNPDILIQLGRAQGLRFDFAAAGDYFEKAIHFSNQKTATLAKIGVCAYDFYNLELAERYLRQATEQKDATAETWVRLARFLVGTRRFSESAQCLEQALRLSPSFPEIPLVRAQLARQAGDLETAEKQFRSALTTTDPWLHMQACNALATLLDQQSRYDEAMAALIQAKAPLQAQAETFRRKREAYNTKRRQVLAGMSADVLQRWSAAGPKLQPARRLALLCGHPRSGTTLLEQVLDSHPDIVASEETRCFHQDIYLPLSKLNPPEPNVADSAGLQLNLETLDAVPLELLRRLRENYFRSMERCLGQPIAGRLLIDKNPELSMLTNGFPRVFPEAKILAVLRDPRDVCLSCFMQNLPQRIHLRHTAHLTLADIVGQYVEEMTLWRTLAPLLQGRYLEVRYEDMVEDLESAARKILDFLGLPWDPGVLRSHERAQRKVMRLSNYADVSKPVYQRARQRWWNYEKFFEPYQEKLAPFVKAFGYE